MATLHHSMELLFKSTNTYSGEATLPFLLPIGGSLKEFCSNLKQIQRIWFPFGTTSSVKE